MDSDDKTAPISLAQLNIACTGVAVLAMEQLSEALIKFSDGGPGYLGTLRSNVTQIQALLSGYREKEAEAKAVLEKLSI